MRITVGHVLILAGTGAYVALGPMSLINSTNLKEKWGGAHSSLGSLVDLFKSGAQPTPTVEVPLAPVSKIDIEPTKLEEKNAASAPVDEPAVPTNSVSAPVSENVAAPAVLESASAVLPSKPVLIAEKATTSNSKNLRLVGRKSKKRKSVKKPAAHDPLAGTYVSLLLKSGREVKGVLEERTGNNYTIQMPGMGPFTYAAENVVRIQPAK